MPFYWIQIAWNCNLYSSQCSQGKLVKDNAYAWRNYGNKFQETIDHKFDGNIWKKTRHVFCPFLPVSARFCVNDFAQRKGQSVTVLVPFAELVRSRILLQTIKANQWLSTKNVTHPTYRTSLLVSISHGCQLLSPKENKSHHPGISKLPSSHLLRP